MCSYNRINGSHACENFVVLGDLKSTLPGGLNFSGWVLSDWGGVHSTVPSALAGLDMEMPGSDYFGSALEQAVLDQQVPLTLIDDKVLRILTPMFAAGLFDYPNTGTEDSNVTSPAHTQLARELAAAGTRLVTWCAADSRHLAPGSLLQASPYCDAVRESVGAWRLACHL